MRKTFYCNVVPLVLHSLERWDKMLLVFYSPSHGRPLLFCRLQGHSGSQFKIRQEDKTQAFWAHRHALLLYLIFEPVPLYVIMSSFFLLCFHLCNILFHFLLGYFFLLAFLFTFSCPCGLSVFQVAHICNWKSSNIPLVGFACVCVFCFFFSLQDCCGIWRLFMACFLTSMELWPIEICGVEKEEHKASQCMWKERLGQKGKLSDFHKQNPYLKTQMRPYEHIWAQLSTAHPGLPLEDCSFLQKTSKREHAS